MRIVFAMLKVVLVANSTFLSLQRQFGNHLCINRTYFQVFTLVRFTKCCLQLIYEQLTGNYSNGQTNNQSFYLSSKARVGPKKLSRLLLPQIITPYQAPHTYSSCGCFRLTPFRVHLFITETLFSYYYQHRVH